MLAPGGEVQQRLGRAVPALDRALDQKLADHLRARRAARLAGRHDGAAASLEPVLQPRDLGRLARSLAAFEGDETPAGASVTTASRTGNAGSSSSRGRPRRGAARRRRPRADTRSSRPSGRVTTAVPTLVPLTIGAGSGPSKRATTRGDTDWPVGAVIWTGVRHDQRHLVLGAQPHRRLDDGVAGAEHRRVGGFAEAPLHQPRRLLRALGHRAQPVHDQDQAPAVAHRRGRLAEAALLRVAGLEAVGARRDLQQAVAVVLLDVVVGPVRLRVVAVVLRESRRWCATPARRGRAPSSTGLRPASPRRS